MIELLALAQAAGRAAAAFISDARPEGRVPVYATKTSLTDVVTEIDHGAERLVRDSLLGARPQDGFVGEESAPTRGTSGVEWIVDPLDGTTNFVYGIPGYAVAIAAQRHGKTDVGYVIDVAHGHEWGAVRGQGAWRLDGEEPRRLTAPEPPPLDQLLVGTGFNYSAAIRTRQGAAMAKLLPQVRDIRRLGAAAIDLCGLAEGRVDAFVEEGLQPWDLAAGVLIAQEAGVDVRGRDGQPDSSLVMAAHPAIAEEYFALIEACGF